MSFKNAMRPVHPGEILREELEAAPRLKNGQPDGLDEANSNSRSIA